MTVLLKQGTLSFRSGYKRQTRWGLSEATVFALECAGAPLVLATLLGAAPASSMLLGLAMVALAIVFLLLHLGHPWRAWMAVRNVRHSWISRGTLALGGFLSLAVLYFTLRAYNALPAEAEAPARWVLVIAGLFIPLYPGLVLSSSPSIPFWNSGLLPVLSFVQGFATAAFMLLALATPDATIAGLTITDLSAGLVIAHVIVTALYLGAMNRRGGAAARSVRLLLIEEPVPFFATGCVLAMALPLAFVLWLMLDGQAPTSALVVLALCRFAGDLALRQAFLKVGLFDPVI